MRHSCATIKPESNTLPPAIARKWISSPLMGNTTWRTPNLHDDDVIKWKPPFPRFWPFVRGIHRSPVNSPHKGQWRGALMFSLSCASINGRVNNREAGDLRRHRAHYDVTVMYIVYPIIYVGLTPQRASDTALWYWFVVGWTDFWRNSRVFGDFGSCDSLCYVVFR